MNDLKGLRIWIPVITFILTGILLLNIAYHFPDGQNNPRITSDAAGYYGYLPAVFIYGNFTELQVNPLQFPTYPGTEKINLKTTCGVAILQLPFFLCTHFVATHQLLGAKIADGYSETYSDGLVACAVFYLILGLILLQSALSRWFPWYVTLSGLLILFFGTNLYYYTVAESGMSHVYSFFLFSWIIWLSPRLYERPAISRFVLLGLVCSLAVLTRLTNLLFVLYPFLYGVSTWEHLRQRGRFFFQHRGMLLLSLFFASLIWIPQFLYWHHLTGSYWFYAYGDEGFSNWNHPKIIEVLFDVQNGLFIYSPLIFPAFIGTIVLAWQRKYQGLAILMILGLATYAIASWWAWWFGAAFGHRAFVEYFAVLSIPLVYVLEWLWKQPWYVLTTSALVIVSGLFYSIRLSHLYRYPWDGPDWTWQSFSEVLSRLFDFQVF